LRRAGLGLLVGLGVYFALIALAAALVTSGTGTLGSRATAWEIASALVGFAAGFAADRTARGLAARPLRYAIALAGPALIALAFALTTHTSDPSGLWIAFAATLAGAALGAALRESIKPAR
jgi:peptidoglycan/LPS O-acetylase OafA/YrhL